MKIKELYIKYCDYDILVFGVPLDKCNRCTPFTRLPKDKKLEDCEVQDIKIEEEPKIAYDFDKNFRFRGISRTKGTVYAYVK